MVECRRHLDVAIERCDVALCETGKTVRPRHQDVAVEIDSHRCRHRARSGRRAAASAAAPAAPAAKRLPKGVTGFRPIVGPVERTAPYTPRTATTRPKMEVREVSPGVMQLVPVETSTSAGAASETPVPASTASGQPEPETPAKRPTRRTGVRKAGTAEAAEIALAREAAEALASQPTAEPLAPPPAEPAVAEAAEAARPVRRRTTATGAARAKSAASRTRKAPEE